MRSTWLSPWQNLVEARAKNSTWRSVRDKGVRGKFARGRREKVAREDEFARSRESLTAAICQKLARVRAITPNFRDDALLLLDTRPRGA